MCHHSSVSLNKEKICHEISEDKIEVCKKTQGLRSGNFSDLNSACAKLLVPVKIFQFHDMHYESERYRDAANGLYPASHIASVQLKKCNPIKNSWSRGTLNSNNLCNQMLCMINQVERLRKVKKEHSNGAF